MKTATWCHRGVSECRNDRATAMNGAMPAIGSFLYSAGVRICAAHAIGACKMQRRKLSLCYLPHGPICIAAMSHHTEEKRFHAAKKNVPGIALRRICPKRLSVRQLDA